MLELQIHFMYLLTDVLYVDCRDSCELTFKQPAQVLNRRLDEARTTVRIYEYLVCRIFSIVCVCMCLFIFSQPKDRF